MSRIAFLRADSFPIRRPALHSRLQLSKLARAGILAGLAGGIAEVIWVGCYAAFGGAHAPEIAGQIANTVFPGILNASAAPAVGLAIHLGLSAILGLALAFALSGVSRHWPAALLPISVGILGLIWVLNFMLVLPSLNPVFPTLLPAWVTLASKLFFGTAFGTAFAIAVGRPFRHKE